MFSADTDCKQDCFLQTLTVHETRSIEHIIKMFLHSETIKSEERAFVHSVMRGYRLSRAGIYLGEDLSGGGGEGPVVLWKHRGLTSHVHPCKTVIRHI